MADLFFDEMMHLNTYYLYIRINSVISTIKYAHDTMRVYSNIFEIKCSCCSCAYRISKTDYGPKKSPTCIELQSNINLSPRYEIKRITYITILFFFNAKNHLSLYVSIL